MRVLSGVQPSGKLHLGNYFGAMKQHLQLQQEHECLYFIAEYHALTSLRNPNVLRRYSLDVALDYLALGLDSEKTIFFRQSDVPQVTQLAWLLSTVTPMGLLERCVSYKDKLARGLPADHGLFAYPVLQAADILIYDSQLVPVGQDQVQHIEVTRDIAQKFNNTYGEVFVLPKPRVMADTAIVPGLDVQKMSKSYGNTIELFEPEKSIRKKVMKIVTDSTPVEDPKDPAKCNVFALLKLLAQPDETARWRKKYEAGGMGYGEAKKRLAELIVSHFRSARQKREELEKDPGAVEEVLRSGAARARSLADKTLQRVRKACGLNP